MWRTVYTCSHCGERCERRSCKQCQRVYYCNPECQRANWPKHKKLCATLQSTKSPKEAPILVQSKRLMLYVDSVFYDGRRANPWLYFVYIDPILSALLSLEVEPYDMEIAPMVEINWDVVPKNGAYALQITDIRVRYAEFREHPLTENLPLQQMAEKELSKLREDVAKDDAKRSSDGRRESGCVVPIMNLSRRFAGYLSELTLSAMTFKTSDVIAIEKMVNKRYPGLERSQTASHLTAVLNELLANDDNYRFPTSQLPEVSASEQRRMRKGPVGPTDNTIPARTLVSRVILSPSPQSPWTVAPTQE
ncbi:hypothetical protein PENSPDRAFT_209619 [Peniophora sp. CONT]|nr:hypothetical protein PENSPDRAFT_209619 [Peniophora sp. CONT]